ncbi:hypothetical protein K488DRAFT_87722 [Vararia minispora EC-137]|uniref:Uncharacterized protein n=1 Tax=Vararia minispora EC-137 TaxID=1314806 RepID=A0ACB8QFH3_9AGAM|nr:hypothetical protein K488DRAFT_87722 [Vararia minispora EC-137]
MSPPTNPADPASSPQVQTLHHVTISTHADEPGALQTRAFHVRQSHSVNASPYSSPTKHISYWPSSRTLAPNILSRYLSKYTSYIPEQEMTELPSQPLETASFYRTKQSSARGTSWVSNSSGGQSPASSFPSGTANAPDVSHPLSAPQYAEHMTD